MIDTMVKRFCISFLLLLCAWIQAAGQPFTFVQMSDPQIGFMDRSAGYGQSDSLMMAAVSAVNALDPAFVLVTGDLVNDPYDPVQDSIYRVRIAGVKAPVYVIPGNHDMKGFSEEEHAHYMSMRASDRFSFQANGCAFIGFDSNCILDKAADFEARQKAWLQAELAAARGCRYIFVFLHCPIIRESMDEKEDHSNFPVAKREEYIGLFKAYGVTAVFAGHTHQEYACEYDGIRFYTAGPVGNAIGHGRSGYQVVRVDADGYAVDYVPTPGVRAPRRPSWPGGGPGRPGRH